jgi:hypothetical protein
MYPRSYFPLAYFPVSFFTSVGEEIGDEPVVGAGTPYFPNSFFPRSFFPGAYFTDMPGTVAPGFHFFIQMDFGAGWRDVTRDVRTSVQPSWRYGIEGSDPSDRIADAGVLTFALNNGDWNTGAKMGWYSPLNTLKRGGFDYNIPVRVVVANAGTLYYKFEGKLSNVHVTPGTHEDRLVQCTAVDLMDDYANVPAPALPAQFNKRGDELVNTILDAIDPSLQPPARAIDTGLDVHPLAFDNVRENEMTVREMLNEVCLSDLGRLFFMGSTSGWRVVYRNRHYTALNTTVDVSVQDEIARGGLDVPGSRDDIISDVQVTVHSTRTDTVATTVLYSLETTTTLIDPGETKTPFGPYRDPDTGEQIGGMDQQPLAPHTDYEMNSASDGSGTDLTATFTATAGSDGGGVKFTVTNNGSVSGYVTKLQQRGRGIHRFPVVIPKKVNNGFGRLLQLDMPFQSSVNVGDDIATYLAELLSRPLARVNSITFLANQSPAMMTAALACEPGSRIAVTEQVTGLNVEQFTILSVSYRMQPAAEESLLWCTWFLEPASTQRFWVMGVPGSSEIGVTTIVGF